jgi:hypothetical protein
MRPREFLERLRNVICNVLQKVYVVIQCKQRPLVRIEPPLYWDDNNVEHLWQSHQVTPDEVEEILFGIEGEDPSYKIRRDGEYYKVWGETGSGRLLKIVLEKLSNGQWRPFGADDMKPAECRKFREG